MATTQRKRPAQPRLANDDADVPLTRAEQRELDRQVKDVDDRRRYLLASVTLPGFSLYYVLQDDVWLLDDPSGATLFKRKVAATAIQKLLLPGVYVVPCTVDARGKLLPGSIENRRVGRVRLAVRPTWSKAAKKKAKRTGRE
jgi:hypothetical protein